MVEKCILPLFGLDPDQNQFHCHLLSAGFVSVPVQRDLLYPSAVVLCKNLQRHKTAPEGEDI